MYKKQWKIVFIKLVFIAFIPLQLISNNSIDSLKQVIASQASLAEKIQSTKILCKKLLYTYPDTSLFYAHKGLDYAKTINDTLSIGDFIHQIAVVNFIEVPEF